MPGRPINDHHMRLSMKLRRTESTGTAAAKATLGPARTSLRSRGGADARAEGARLIRPVAVFEELSAAIPS